MNAEPRDPLIQLAERVATVASELGMSTALIGATALAAHNYVRGTADIDLAIAVDPFKELRLLGDRLKRDGFLTELNLPDAEDSLGGVLRVWATSDDDDPVEVVNFNNPFSPSNNPGLEAVRTATPVGVGTSLRCATLPHLIALKLYAGGRRDQADVVELLRRNPGADRAEIREVCARYGFEKILEELIGEV
jgi:hypothetical protein